MTSLIFRDRNQTPSIWNSFFNDLTPDSFFTDVLRTPSLKQFTQENPVKVHIDKADNAYDVSIAAPGISKNEVDVTVKDNVENISASYESGVFNVNLPRVQPVEPEVKKIKVK